MCGIAGFIDPTLERDGALALLARMADTIRHRGPDGEGLWFDAATGVGLAHRRLSIIDLSAAGAQPMTSPSGRFVAVYNGEIYNHRQIRTELLAREPGRTFRGHSDTEVLLAAFDTWGIEATLARANGMFALALYDTRQRELHLMRDRIGEKPLYVAHYGERLVFASEIKALRPHPSWRERLDTDAMVDYFRLGYVPAPRSIYANVSKVAPGEWLTVGLPLTSRETVCSRRYWSAPATVRRGLERPLDLDDEEALAQLQSLLQDAVALRMEADVPLGAFLSGGIDSSIVVSLMQKVAARPVQTFSIGFEDPRFDEAPAARAVAEHLRTEHTELYVSARQSLDILPRLAPIFDEPFADASQIPTLLVAQLARRQVTVALSGDGGDELFCGYRRYETALNLWRGVDAVPHWARRALSSVIGAVPVPALNALGSWLPNRMTSGRAGDRAHKAALRLSMRSFDDVYRSLMSSWQNPASAVHREVLRSHGPLSRLPNEPIGPAYERMMASDLCEYLPGDVLAKVDRTSMAVSLEGRMPLLDPRVVEFAWRLPMHLKMRNGTGKWLLRELLYRHVPRALVDRPKRGFAVPIDRWLKHDLREWTDDLLSRENLLRDGLLDTHLIHRMLREHRAGQRSWKSQLWTVLMFQAWRQAHAHS